MGTDLVLLDASALWTAGVALHTVITSLPHPFCRPAEISQPLGFNYPTFPWAVWVAKNTEESADFSIFQISVNENF